MVVVDPLFPTTAFTKKGTPRCFRNTVSCHMRSTLPGQAGTEELLAFARRIKLRRQWLQEEGTTREHFDLTEARRAAAVAAGAQEITRSEMARLGRPRRGAEEVATDANCP